MHTDTHRLTPATLADGCRYLLEVEPAFGRIVSAHGPPPLYVRDPGFPTLILLILEQQVSLASARAAYNRLLVALGGTLTPALFLTLDDDALFKVGFSRQKRRYGRLLSEALLSGNLDLAALENQPDAAVRTTLMQLKGIGTWTANVYLMTALRRLDIWPVKDRALVVALREIKGLGQVPTHAEAAVLGERYRPWRSVATHLLWHYYLSR